MKPYTNTDLPIAIKYDLELMRILLRAKELLGTYNAIIQYQDIDPNLVLKPFILQEAFKSCELSGNKIPQSLLYYINYQRESDDICDIKNYKRVLLKTSKFLTPNFKLSFNYLNKMHKDLNNSIRGNYKDPGKIRKKLTWIGRRGSTIHSADFVPVSPLEIGISMSNYISHFNKKYAEDYILELAISHAQFENIHPYNDANGRIGRALIPLQAYLSQQQEISLFLSEAIKENEYTYYQKLQDTRKGKWESYIKFFIRMIITQLEKNIEKLKEINKLYKEDLEKVSTIISPKNVSKVYNFMFSNIVFTIREMSTELNIDYQTVRNYLNRMFSKGIVAKHKIRRGEYTYTYIKMYNIHVPIEWL